MILIEHRSISLNLNHGIGGIGKLLHNFKARENISDDLDFDFMGKRVKRTMEK